MNIKEIAKMAEVSVSTVSKIMNGKDQNISCETRERVLRIVKEAGYKPYAGIVPAVMRGKSFVLGVTVSGRIGHDSMLAGILEAARAEGYVVIVCSAGDAKEEYRNLSLLCGHPVDGIIWDKVEGSDPDCEGLLKKYGVPFLEIDCGREPSPNNFCFDYCRLGYAATRVLAERKHQRLLCLAEKDTPKSRRFLEGFSQCLYDHQVGFDANMFRVADPLETRMEELPLLGCTGIVCSSAALAGRVYEEAARKNRKIPRELSVVGLAGDRDEIHLFPKLATVRLPFFELGAHVCRTLVSRIESRGEAEAPFNGDLPVDEGGSVDVPATKRNKKIVVAGALNVDTLISLGTFPKMGETMMTSRRATIPGGKGINQAIGAARLGAEAYLIGKTGKDYDGSLLYEFLQQNGVNVDGVTSTSRASTGHAYVYVQDDGESGIVIYDGANSQLSIGDIEKNARLFQNASFCLLQTEIRMETVEYAAMVARKNGARVLLKPAAASSLSDELLRNIDILLPNRNEISLLCPQEPTLERKAQHFLDRGVRHVIITLGNEGCYLRDAEHAEYFEAARFIPVDTTGAADAFASCLAVYLAKNYDIRTAIRYATYAAGFSTTRQGVPPSLIDTSTLELYSSET